MSSEPPVDTLVLPHLSLNEGAKPTILIIHGAFTSAASWEPIHQYLPNYHLLIPNLPRHGQSVDISPLSFEHTSELLAYLVKTKAHDKQVHAVGHSLGASLTLHFACHYPDLISSVFVLGLGCLPKSGLLPHGLLLEGAISSLLPRQLIEYLIDVQEDMKGKEQFGGWRSLKTAQEISCILSTPLEEFITPSGREELGKRGVKVLVVAATKRGVLPTNDSEHTAQLAAELVGGAAMAVSSVRHAWNLQNPKLLANGIQAWIEQTHLPEEFLPITA